MSVQSYIEFVEKQIQELKKVSALIREGQVLPARLNTCLAQYQGVALSLNAEYQRLKSIEREKQMSYQAWWDQHFIGARNKLNEDRTTSKFASKNEVESQLRFDNAEEYRGWQNDLRDAENKVRFMLRLIDSWKAQKDILITLSNNMRTEMRNLHVEDWANKLPTEGKLKPQRVIK